MEGCEIKNYKADTGEIRIDQASYTHLKMTHTAVMDKAELLA